MTEYATCRLRAATIGTLFFGLSLQAGAAFAQPNNDDVKAKTFVPNTAAVETVIKYTRELQTHAVAVGAFNPSNTSVAARITVLVKDTSGRPITNLIDDTDSQPDNTSQQGSPINIGPFRITARLPLKTSDIFPVSCAFVAYRARNLSDEGIYGGYEFLGAFKQDATACVYKTENVLAQGAGGEKIQATTPEPVIYSVALEGGAGKNKNQYGSALGEIHPPVAPTPIPLP